MVLMGRLRRLLFVGFAVAGWGWLGATHADASPDADSSAARLLVSPRQTEVYVDGNPAGTADDFDGFTQRLRVPPGPHEIELFLQGYRSVRENVLFAPGQSYKLRHRMEPLTPGEPEPERPKPGRAPAEVALVEPRQPSYGTLSITVRPLPATVWIDDERWEALESEALSIQLAEGRHRVEIEGEGRSRYSTIVRVLEGETTTLNVGLAEGRSAR